MNWVNFSKVLTTGSTIWSYTFFKEINTGESFHVSQNCQDDLLFSDYCTQNFFFAGESLSFHSLDCLFDSGLYW